MVIDGKEDQTAPVSEEKIKNTIDSKSDGGKKDIINLIVRSFNEKRDAYNGITSSVIYVYDSQDIELIENLLYGICKSITAYPMLFGGKMFINKALPRLIVERPNFVIELFEYIIEKTPIWSKNFQDKSQVLKIQITCIKAIRQAEQTVCSRTTKIPAEEIEKLCLDAIYSCDDRTKIDTLSLILASRSTSRPITEEQFRLFRIIFQNALSLQEPSLRQMFLSQTNKLLIRMVDSIRVFMREVNKSTEEERFELYTRYNNFIRWLITSCFDNIYCNAYFGSFIITMSTLKMVIQHITYSNQHLPIESLCSKKSCYDSLVSCLTDSFEENKSSALELLMLLPINEEFVNDAKITQFETIAYQLVTSVNPAHSLTSLYVFRLTIGLSHKLYRSNRTKNQLLLEHLSKLVDIVEENVQDTRDNFIQALKHKSIYPKLTCIRALLSDIEMKELEDDRVKWQVLAKRIVSTSIDACQAVSTIVCNLNPETIGHLPMDLKPVDVESLAKSLKVSLRIPDTQVTMISSQMLLISGWKTIKECSLSLGAMCLRFWWPKERIQEKHEKFPGFNSDPILEYDDIVKIIKFFDHYLRNLRHRGAFEQAYNGFIMVTRRIWRDETFRSLLMGTLNEIMDDFKSNALDGKKAECLKAYVTRRSAGLPFIIQAILNSEHKHDSTALRSVMDCLFKILDSKKAEEYQRIHCLNILIAIVKEHFLGEKMLPYLGTSFEIALDSFRSDSFPIRNCANMLLKAVVDRTFGVNRLRDDIHRRNQLSFDQFFQECPTLHAKMLKHLEDGLSDKKFLAAVHAVFIILNRLKPSVKPDKEYSHEKMIIPYIRLIINLAYTCPDYKLRKLAARLAVKLMSFCYQGDNQETVILQEQSISELKEIIFNRSNGNKLHGTMLLAESWVDCPLLSSKGQDRFYEFAKQASREILLNLERTNSHYISCTIKTAALDIVEACCFSKPDSIEWLTDFYPWCVNMYSSNDIAQQQEPYYEAVLFKSTCLLLMSFFNEMTTPTIEGDKLRKTGQEIRVSNSRQLLDLIPEFIMRPHNRVISLDTQASLIRFLRQSFSDKDEFVDDILLEKLDMDLTAAHITVFDKLNLMTENTTEREKWLGYCERPKPVGGLEKYINLSKLFNFSQYEEFKPNVTAQNKSLDSSRVTTMFSTKRSNTPRAIELLIFAYKNWDKFDLAHTGTWCDNANNLHADELHEKLEFLSRFIESLPDCDIRCLALLCAGKLMLDVSNAISDSNTDQDRNGNRAMAMERFSELLNNLADGEHSFTMRIACSEVLRLTLRPSLERRDRFDLERHFINLFSSLIKLTQDEEYQVRLSSRRVILSLNKLEHDCSDESKDTLPNLGGTGLNQLFKLIRTKLDYRKNIVRDLNNYFELLMSVIFNHSKNYSNDPTEEKERLFDKTKLNTFADDISAIESALKALQVYIRMGQQDSEDGKADISNLRFPLELLKELCPETYAKYKDCPISIGDKREIIDGFLEQTLEYMNYFVEDYVNVLTDTDYTFRELTLFRKIAFIKFISDCTNHEIESANSFIKMGETIRNIVDNGCATTILCKIDKLLSS